MPAVDNITLFERLSAAQRLVWVDSLAAAVADIIDDMGAEYADDIVRTLLDIKRMLQVMREDLAMIDDPHNRAIIGYVQNIIRAMRTCVGREIVGPAFH
ncbi:hypothetical protein QA646_20655 (plasmid) [Rhizobium sp. CB3090]|uniref:hypothetical protein n=1 Tax=Rhizobium sp. CB3090 TaxID=3039156 RepID=UPI0024B1EB5E|nr:hypothetical protein [Rhizobium sp. CB3090]WFU12328.1 hypothetical protein QA646_20655 [Rhizobium sp. CB3090]